MKFLITLLCLCGLNAIAADGVVSVLGGNGQIGGTIPASALPAGVVTNGFNFIVTGSNSFIIKDSAGATVTISNGTVQAVNSTNSGNFQSATLNVTSTSGAAASIGVAGNSGAALTVKGTAKDAAYFQVDTTDKGFYIQQLTSGSAYARFGFLDSSSFGVNGFASKNMNTSPHSADLIFWSRDAAGTVQDNRLTIIGTNGLVGIGKTTPVANLDVVGNIAASTTIAATNGFVSYARNLLATTAITVGSSPFSWTNSAGTNNVVVYVDGVSVTGTIGINGTTVFNTIGQCTVILQPGEYTTVTYTIGTPTATFKPF